jgi:hypothetical protein
MDPTVVRRSSVAIALSLGALHGIFLGLVFLASPPTAQSTIFTFSLTFTLAYFTLAYVLLTEEKWAFPFALATPIAFVPFSFWVTQFEVTLQAQGVFPALGIFAFWMRAFVVSLNLILFALIFIQSMADLPDTPVQKPYEPVEPKPKLSTPKAAAAKRPALSVFKQR